MFSIEVLCPPGTYYSNSSSCDLCPVNTFKSHSGNFPCSPCENGTVTQMTGRISQEFCQSKYKYFKRFTINCLNVFGWVFCKLARSMDFFDILPVPYQFSFLIY